MKIWFYFIFLALQFTLGWPFRPVGLLFCNMFAVCCFLTCMITSETLPHNRKASSIGRQFNIFLIHWLINQTFLFQVEQYDAFRDDYIKAESFTYENVSTRVLGQHGIALLMERECSFFFPTGVVGMLCIGTKVSI